MTDHELFLNRTDALANKMRLTLKELLDVVGLSKGAFSGYRTGRLPISAKAWRKLEAAEQAAGIGVDAPNSNHDLNFENPPDINERLARLEELLLMQAAGIGVDASNGAHVRHLAKPPEEDGGLEQVQARLGRIESDLARLTAAVEALVKTRSSSSDRGQVADRKKLA